MAEMVHVVGHLGHFLSDQQQFYTYVRLFDDNNVYVANNFMSFSVPTGAGSYRNQKITQLIPDSVSSIYFNYPADSSFVLTKSISEAWIVDNRMADSIKIESYLGSLSRISSSMFAEDQDLTVAIPVFQVRVRTTGSDDLIVNAFAETDSTFLITSSANRDGIFQDPSLLDRIFLKKSDFAATELQ